MRHVFFKDLRENARWAALLAGVVAVWVYVRTVMYDADALGQVGNVLMIMGPLAGVVLGVAQWVFDVRPDNWAFDVHRPVSRGGVFAAKSAAGLGLLYAALGVPVLVCAAWSMRPGRAPWPFDGTLVVPPLVDAAQATVWYFLGVTLTLRRARWYGSRLLPLGLGLVAGAWVSWVPYLWMALLGVAVAVPLMAGAAWEAFCAGGEASGSRWGRAGLAASMVPGCLLLVLLVASLASGLDETRINEYYGVERNGRAVVAHARQDRSGPTFWVTGVDGTPLPEYAGLDQDSPALRDRWARYWSVLPDDRFIAWPGSSAWTGYRTAARRLVSVDGGYSPGPRPPERASFAVPRGVIELYDAHTRLPIGTVGPGGFAAAGEAPRGRFPGKPLNVTFQRRNHTLAFPSVVYWMELDRRRVRPIFTAAEGDPVVSAADFDPPEAQHLALVMTRRHLHVIDPSGAGRLEMTGLMEFDHGRYSGVAVTRLEGGNRIYANAWWEGDDEKTAPHFEFAADGTLLRRVELPALGVAGWNSRAFAVVMGLGSPAAAVPLYGPWRLERHFHIRRRMGPFWDAYVKCFIASAAVSAAAGVVLARVYGRSVRGSIGWGACGALLGPTGVAVLVSMNERPVMERCPGCGRARAVAEARCRTCGVGHAPPVSDGREIFEPLGVAGA